MQLYSCKISCRCTRTTPYHSTQNVLKTFCCSSIQALLTFPDCSMVESVTEVPDLQVTKMGKSSILCLFFLLSVVSQASTITAETIIVIQMQNKNSTVFGYCTHHLLFKFKCGNPLKGHLSPLLKNCKVLCPWVFICKTTVHVQSFEQ